MKRRFLLLLLLCLLPWTALAVTNVTDPDGLVIGFKQGLNNWTFVTPDNYEQYMELCTSRGCSENDVRERFSSGRIVWEVYHPTLPLGCIRYEKWSDLATRNIWSMSEIKGDSRKSIRSKIEES